MKPNILFVLADDLGWGDLSSHGSPIRTPHIDRLMAAGLELNQHYVQPMCTPTRASLLTGRYPSRFGSHATVPSNLPVIPDAHPTLPSILGANGYKSGLFGKWHLGATEGSEPNKFGFDYSYGSLSGGVDPYNHKYRSGDYSHTWHRNGRRISENGHATDLITEECISWIERQHGPWFAYLSFTAVHAPIKAPVEWIDSYRNQIYDENVKKDESFKRYAGYTSHMDSAIGSVIQAIDKKRELDNTLVVFTSDNGAIGHCPLHAADVYPGWQQDSPRLGSNLPYRGFKAQLYEGGIRTPTLIYWKNKIAPNNNSVPMHISDWLPTICDVLEISLPDETKSQLDGTNVWNDLMGNSHVDRTIYWNFKGGDGLAIRFGKWKLITSKNDLDEGKQTELYNIDQDPYEKNNLAKTYPERTLQLLNMIKKEYSCDYLSVRKDLDRFTDPLSAQITS